MVGWVVVMVFAAAFFAAFAFGGGCGWGWFVLLCLRLWFGGWCLRVG